MKAHSHATANILKYFGDVASVDAGASSLVVNDKGMAITIKTTEKTAIMSGKEKKTLADIAVGTKVKAVCTKSNGVLVASKIIIEPATVTAKKK